MRVPAATLLRRLEATRSRFGGAAATTKIELLGALSRARLATADQVLRLHEHLCFLRAYPDDRRVLAAAERLLRSFASRTDLRRHRAALAGSGIAGTDLRDRFFWPMARWLAARWPERLDIDWESLEDDAALANALPLLVTPVEAAWLRSARPAARAAIERLRGPRTSGGVFFVRRVQAMPGDEATREAFFDGVDVDMILTAGPRTPSRTHARYRPAPVVFRERGVARERPDLRTQLAIAPRAVRAVPPREGQTLIDLAREAMVTRTRDLDAFAYGDPADVRLVDDGDGLQWAMIGMLAERRAPLRAAYGHLMLRSGVPIGYVQTDSLFGCADLSFNTFPTFRGGEAAFLFARLLALAKHLLGARSYTIEPYQLGQGNEEAIESGAWWFYYKLGFRPRSASIRSLVRTELNRMRRKSGYRSPHRILTQLAEDYLYFEPEGLRAPHWPSVAALGARVSARLASLAGAERVAALAGCVDRVRAGLGARAARGAAERIAWKNWAPLVELLPGVGAWSRREQAALAEVVFAKGGRRETDFLARFDAHPKLGAALLRLAVAPLSAPGSPRRARSGRRS